MNQRKLIILALTLTIVFLGGSLLVFFAKGTSEEKKADDITPAKTQTIILCPLAREDCEIAMVETVSDVGYEYSILGYHNAAESTPVFASFDGKIEVLEMPVNNEKSINILSNDGETIAEYKFLGLLAEGIEPGAGEVKIGQLIGYITTRLSYYSEKYNLTFKLYDKSEKKYVNFGPGESKSSLVELIISN